MSEMEPPKVLTRQEAADYLRVSLRTIDRMCKDGTLPYRRVRHGIRILASAVFIAPQQQKEAKR